MFSFLRRAPKASPLTGAELAYSLAAEGRFARALKAAADARPDWRLERDMALWRHRAFVTTPAQTARADWPPKLDDPFPDLADKIPQIAARELSGDVLGGALQHHGSLIIRGLFDPQSVAELRDGVDEAYSERALHISGRDGQSAYKTAVEIEDIDLHHAREWLHGGSLLMVDAPKFLNRWSQVVRGSGAYAAVAGYLGEDPVLSAKKTTLYRIPGDTVGQWHQDGAFLGEDTRTVNLWVALSDCGIDAPGLDIIPWRLPNVVTPGTHGSPFDWSVGDLKVAEMTAQRPMESPVFRAGDAILFDHLCLHRTGVRPGMTKPRYALETWMFAPSHYPDGVPLVI